MVDGELPNGRAGTEEETDEDEVMNIVNNLPDVPPGLENSEYNMEFIPEGVVDEETDEEGGDGEVSWYEDENNEGWV